MHTRNYLFNDNQPHQYTRLGVATCLLTISSVMKWLVSLVYKVLALLGTFKDSGLSGHLDVVGSSTVKIRIGNNRNVLSVLFDDNDDVVLPPCGGGLPDLLDWQLIRVSKHDYLLEITWSVQRPRHVRWSVSRR